MTTPNFKHQKCTLALAPWLMLSFSFEIVDDLILNKPHALYKICRLFLSRCQLILWRNSSIIFWCIHVFNISSDPRRRFPCIFACINYRIPQRRNSIGLINIKLARRDSNFRYRSYKHNFYAGLVMVHFDQTITQSISYACWYFYNSWVALHSLSCKRIQYKRRNYSCITFFVILILFKIF